MDFRFLDPERDLDALHEVVSHYEVVKNTLSWPHPADRAFTARRCKPYEGDGAVWGVFEGGQLQGTIGVTNGELGYILHPRAWGRGLASRAGAEAVRRGFEEYGCDQIVAGTHTDNIASQAVLAKLGFEKTGTSRDFCRAMDKEVDGYDFTLTRQAWEARI